MSIERTLFDTMPDGRDVYLYTIENSSGVKAGILTRGATLNNLITPDKDGVMGDIIAGFDTILGHINSGTFTGAVVGQYANRIANGEITLGGKKYELTKNENGITCLHGGGEYNSALWKPMIIDDNAIEFSYTSPDGENGFPGNVDVTVTYILTDHNELEIHYKAVSDKDTILNLTNHAYFNLGTTANGDVLDTELMIDADFYTPTDEHDIPTGEILSVENTPFDFRTPKKIGRDITSDDPQIVKAHGYDHNFCLKGEPRSFKVFAKAKDEKSGRTLEASTDLPGVQLYTGNFMDGEMGKDGIGLDKHYGFCLETQFYPDTPNRQQFPSCVLKAGEEFESVTIFKV